MEQFYLALYCDNAYFINKLVFIFHWKDRTVELSLTGDCEPP